MTLIELLVCIFVIAILLALLLGSLNIAREKAVQILESLGFSDFEKSPKYIEVLNKIDLFDDEKKQDIILKQRPQTVALSAISGEGCDKLLKLIEDKLSIDYEVVDIDLSVADGKKMAWLHSNSEVVSCNADEDNIHFKVKISKENLAKFEAITQS